MNIMLQDTALIHLPVLRVSLVKTVHVGVKEKKPLLNSVQV